MAYWKTNIHESSVKRNKKHLDIIRLDHAAVFELTKELKIAINKEGYNNLIIDFASVENAYPDAMVPFAGIFAYYKSQGISFSFQNLPNYLKGNGVLNPTPFNFSSNVLNNVWTFSSSADVAKIVDAYIEEFQKSARFPKGVLNAIEWSLNEVMDNVIQHAGTECGYVMGQIHPNSQQIVFTVCDTGQGIYNSLKGSIHKPRNAADAITLAIKEDITRDKNIGQGNGLFGLHSIVKQGKGKLVITSGTGSYIFNNGITKTYTHLPVISLQNPGTIVDFQLSYNENLSLDKALIINGAISELINYRIESMEDDNGRILYKIKDHANGTGTRESAIRVKNEIYNILEEKKRTIILSFEGVEVISSSFADELLAKLLIELGLFQFNNLFRIIGMDESQQRILQRSVLQRIKETLLGK